MDLDLARQLAVPNDTKVLLVVIDGLGAKHSYNLPFIDRIRSKGIHALAASHAPTISMPNYVSIVTGVEPRSSGVRNNFYPWPVALDSIMVRLHDAGKQSAFVSDSSTGFPHMFSPVTEEATHAPWPGGFVKACRLAVARDYALVIFVPCTVDEAGHLHGAASAAYRAAAVAVDDELWRCLADVDLSDTTVVIAADHGHTDRGGHGGLDPWPGLLRCGAPPLERGADRGKDGTGTGAGCGGRRRAALGAVLRPRFPSLFPRP
jgi:predicted AlkP superfamily pyrophosphatase or phosphodiesterase